MIVASDVRPSDRVLDVASRPGGASEHAYALAILAAQCVHGADRG